MLNTAAHLRVDKKAQAPFVKSRRGTDDVSNLIGLQPGANHDAKSNATDHGNVTLLKND
jgi:hypothetical protein